MTPDVSGSAVDLARLRRDRLLDGRLKLRHLVLLTAIADHGTLVRAAEHLHITQPVVTRGLHDLETALQVRLFDRGPYGVTPTIFGSVFISHARGILGQIRQAGQDLDDLAHAHAGTVRVGTHLAGSNILLPKAIGLLKASSPRVTVIVRETTPDVLLAALLAGELDLMVGRLTASPTEAGVRQQTLYREPIGLVTRPSHPAQSMGTVTLADLVDYPWILPVEQTGLRLELEQLFLNAGLSLPENRIECTSILTLTSLLIDTDVIAALPILIAHTDPRLAVLPTKLEPLRRAVGVTVAAGREPSPTLNAMLTSLQAVAADILKRPDISSV